MRPRAVILSTLASAATLGVGWAAWALPAAQQAQAQAVTTAADAAATSSSPTASTSQSATASATASASASATATASASATATQAAAASSGLKDGSYLGSAVSTRYGVVQVTAVISGGQLTDVVATDVNATGGRLAAVPMLRSEALAAQSANISVISNATYTSDGYMQSLQSALDQAK